MHIYPLMQQQWAEAARRAAQRAEQRTRACREELWRRSREQDLSSSKTVSASLATTCWWTLRLGSPLHPLSCVRTEVLVGLTQEGCVDFSRPPRRADAKEVEGYVRMCSDRGIGPLSLVWRLSSDCWGDWLDGTRLEEALEKLGDLCCRDEYDDPGEFLALRWRRLDCDLALGQEPPEEWRLQALAAVLAPRLCGAGASSDRPSPGSQVVAEAPPRLEKDLRAVRELSSNYGLVVGGTLHGGNLYGKALELAASVCT